MIFRVIYKTSNKTEILIPWEDVWNGEYKKKLFGVFEYCGNNGKGIPKITEYKSGLVWEMMNDVPLPEMPVVTSNVPKTKIKISEVFKRYENFFTAGIVADVYDGTPENG